MDEVPRSVVAVDCCAALSELVEVLCESEDCDVVAEGELLLLEEPEDWVQLFSSRKAACPLTVIGVKVTLHVSVTGPEDP